MNLQSHCSNLLYQSLCLPLPLPLSLFVPLQYSLSPPPSFSRPSLCFSFFLSLSLSFSYSLSLSCALSVSVSLFLSLSILVTVYLKRRHSESATNSGITQCTDDSFHTESFMIFVSDAVKQDYTQLDSDASIMCTFVFLTRDMFHKTFNPA